MPRDKQQRIAQETLDIYAPLAHRLGMQEIKQQLEDLSFAALHPKRYAEIDHLVATRTPERDVLPRQVIAEVQARLQELRHRRPRSPGGGKHLWSIYEKMVVKGSEFDDIFDLVAIRVIVDSVKDCYAALGCIHGRWKPVVGRFKDYIAMPKFNLYQSLHTTVIGPAGQADRGADPHPRDAPAGRVGRGRALGVQGATATPPTSPGSTASSTGRPRSATRRQFMENLKTDLEQDEVFVFTPKGKVITLPVGSTPVDFAYAVHTEVGHAASAPR